MLKVIIPARRASPKVLSSPPVKEDLSIVQVLRSTCENPDELELAGGIRTHTRVSEIDRETAALIIRPVLPPSQSIFPPMQNVVEVSCADFRFYGGQQRSRQDLSKPVHLYLLLTIHGVR